MTETSAQAAGRSWWRVPVLVLLAAAIVAVLVLLPVKDYLTRFIAEVRGLGVWGPVMLAAAYVPACLFFLPGSLLTLGAGFAFGLVRGTIAVSLGSVAGATAAFLAGRTLLRQTIEARIARYPRFNAVDKAVQLRGFRIVLLTRLSPLFPFNLLNYGFGVTRVSLFDYVLGSWLGMFPGTAMYVYLGSALSSLTELSGASVNVGGIRQIFFGVGLLATIVVTIYVSRLARKALNEMQPAQG